MEVRITVIRMAKHLSNDVAGSVQELEICKLLVPLLLEWCQDRDLEP